MTGSRAAAICVQILKVTSSSRRLPVFVHFRESFGYGQTSLGISFQGVQDDRGEDLNIDGGRGVLDLPPKLAKKIDKPREFPDSHDGGTQILGLLRLVHDAPGVGFEVSLRAWLEASGIESGPVFRPINRHGQIRPMRLSDRAVALIVKRAAEAAGKDPAEFAGHSLRSGLATAAAIGGASERAIMNQTGHRSTAMVRRYIRDGSLFRENAAARVGL